MKIRKHCTYIFLIRRNSAPGDEIQELAGYFRMLNSLGCEVLVVDSSPLDVFAGFEGAWYYLCRHVKVDSRFHYLSDKLNSICTGADLATCEKIIVAEDDVRYSPADILRMCEMLEDFDLVRPQNYISPLQWWSRMESVHTLMNRAVFPGGDYSNTLAFLNTAFKKHCHFGKSSYYDSDDIIMQFALRRAKICYALDFLILKKSPSLSCWRDQMFQNIFDNFDFSLRTVLLLLLIPVGILLALFAGPKTALIYSTAVILSSITVAFMGRHRGGRQFYPIGLLVYAPLWLLDVVINNYRALYWILSPGKYSSLRRVLKKRSKRPHIRISSTIKLYEGNRKN
ncbi:MAG: hypothetical protein ACM3S2_21690 [Ignavibacteriales bacterium]